MGIDQLGDEGRDAPSKTFASMANSSALVTNGSVDFRGRIADKTLTGGWKASPFIIGIGSYLNFSLFVRLSVCLSLSACISVKSLP